VRVPEATAAYPFGMRADLRSGRQARTGVVQVYVPARIQVGVLGRPQPVQQPRAPVAISPLADFERFYYPISMYCVACRNQVKIGGALRHVEPPQPETVAKDVGPVLAVADAPSSAATATASASASTASSASGTLNRAQLEELWDGAGGAPGRAVTAATTTMAGSVRGQLSPYHGGLATYDPEATAEAAVVVCDDRTNRTPWMTFLPGAYEGQC